MFLSILRNSRRDMLRIALTQFLEGIKPEGLSAEAAERYAVLQSEARSVLREISASETLHAAAHPPSEKE